MNQLIKTGAIYELIQQELSQLPGESAHIEMMPTRLRTSEALKHKGTNPRVSAVLCLLHQIGEELHILLMERTKDGGKHSGQISFPGGKQEPSDQNLQFTALRETHEEVGIPADQVQILGTLSQVYIPVSNFLVTPYIGWMNQLPELNLSVREVASVFSINTNTLLDPASKIERNIPIHNGHYIKKMYLASLLKKKLFGAPHH